MTRRSTPLTLGIVALAMVVASGVALAKESRTLHHAAARPHPVIVAATGAQVPYRGLTINRAPALGSDDLGQDVYRDGPVRYNDIRDFSPAPYTTSGVQFPYGLDGVGGYGSDVDGGAGEDAALLDRGAGTEP